ncbi:MAG: hypothetical protein JWQ83_879 [Lacunisphaera sp.]|nr:hypothetical protein [Lacunisphaera sp.]
MDPKSYQPFRNLPALAGVATFDEAMIPGLTVEAAVARLKRHHWAFNRLREIFTDRITAEPIYELKVGFSLHAHYCAEHATAWRNRVGEMREPPLGLDTCPDAALEVFFDEILAAPHTEGLVLGLYGHAVPRLRDALRQYLQTTNKLVDHPSHRICRFALIELDEMTEFGAGCIGQLVSAERRRELAPWVATLDMLLAQAGGLDGAAPVAAGILSRVFSQQPHRYDPMPQRDERFFDRYNMGVAAGTFVHDEKYPADPKMLMLYYKRMREIDVPEMMASILVETKGKPWGYYRDLTRQLWDEARHAMMGEIGFVRAGLDWRKLVPFSVMFSERLNTLRQPLERHGALYFIEQGLMPKTGKRYEWEIAVAANDPFGAMIQDYDWADEVLHARIGREWYVKQFSEPKTAIAFGEKALVFDADPNAARRELVARGLTQHRNWWPDANAEWCRVRGEKPDPAVLAYNPRASVAPPTVEDASG